MPGKQSVMGPAPAERYETLPRIREPHELTVIDLFSGAGGMTCGFWQMGFRLLGAVDKQVGKPSEVVPCNDTYRLNYGITPHDFDMYTLSATFLRDDVIGIAQGQLTVLISCPPCTGYSQKRHQNATKDDDRNVLVARTAAFVDAFRPEFLVMENVPEMLKGRFTQHWGQLLRELQRLGYTVWADVVDLSKLGLPQHRKRALVIARRGGGEVPDVERRARQTPAPDNVRITLEKAGLPPLVAENYDSADPVHASPRIGGRASRVLERCRLIRDKGQGRWVGLKLPELSSAERDLLTGRIRTALEAGDRKTYPDCYGTIRPNDLSPTLIRQCGDIGTGPWFHWSEDRMLTAREMAILQGFPYHSASPGGPFYRFAGSLSKVYQQIGNAVPPLVSRVIAEEILDLLEGRPGLSPEEIPLRPWLLV